MVCLQGADWKPKLLNGHSARTLAVKYKNLTVVEMIDRKINDNLRRQSNGEPEITVVPFGIELRCFF